jgi:outer membrane receptor protein involved in Fe transport
VTFLRASAALLPLFFAFGVWAEGAYRGRPLAAVLDELRADGLRLVYSTSVVTPEMRVEVEPQARDPRQILDEILVPHGLAAEEGPEGLLLVVPRDKISSTPTLAPNDALSGVVRDARTGAPVAGARVSVGTTSTTTGDDGAFQFESLPRGERLLRAARAGYIVFEAPVEAGDSVTVNLLAAPVALDDLIVTPSQTSLLSGDPEQRQFLSREDVTRIPHLSDDLFRALGRLPGTASNDISATFNIRGGEDDETLVILDGLEIDEPFHLKDFQSLFSIVDSEAVGGVEFMPGGFPAQYGDRMSGVIELSSSTATEPRRTYAGVSFVNTRFLTQGTIGDGRGEWLLSARRGYIDLVLDLVDPDIDVDPTYYDLFGKLQLNLSQRHILSANVLVARDDFVFDEDGEEVTSDYGNDYLWLNLRSGFTDRLFAQSVIYSGSGRRGREGGIDDFSGLAVISDERSFDVLGVKQDWSWSAGERNVLKFGWDVRQLDAEYDYFSDVEFRDPFFHELINVPPRRTTTVSIDPSGTARAAYISDRIRVSPSLAFEAGLRYDEQSYVGGGDEQLSPRISLLWQAAPSTALRAAWGHYFQSQGINELEVQDGQSEFYDAQKSEQYLLSIAQQLPRGLHVRLDGYLKRFSELRPRYENLFDTLELFPEVEFDRVRVEPESGDARGVELLVERKSAGRLQWWVSYARSRATDRVDGRDVLRAWDQRDAVSFSLNWVSSPKWNLNVAGVYHSGWPTTEVRGELIALSPTTATIRPILGARNGIRHPPYHRLDVRATRNVAVARGSLRFFVEIFNIFDRENVCCIGAFEFAVDGAGNVTVDPLEDRNVGWLPSFGIAYEF